MINVFLAKKWRFSSNLKNVENNNATLSHVFTCIVTSVCSKKQTNWLHCKANVTQALIWWRLLKNIKKMVLICKIFQFIILCWFVQCLRTFSNSIYFVSSLSLSLSCFYLSSVIFTPWFKMFYICRTGFQDNSWCWWFYLWMLL